ncbi:MAG: hypothetical protein BV459_04100 [Thermoplasmata archaeon M11B2D]|nr:MAG: hypothetical protein BV459_04100 [Thermoplasmata archaeon M11B2D]PNX50031.1 MAG: hypothetical protein BV458_13925 [Thermoplasmata archaeon M9B2D]
MKKQTMGSGVIVTLFCSFLLFSGCTEQNDSESIQTILEKATAIPSVYYELGISTVITDWIEESTEMKIWEKAPYLKQEIRIITGDIIIPRSIIKRPEGIYHYNEEQQAYVLDPQFVISQPTIIETVTDLLQNQTLTTLGTESIDGLPTTVIQYTSRQNGNSTTTTLWIWNEKGVPLKAHSILENGEITETVDTKYINYSFSDIPESVFSVE